MSNVSVKTKILDTLFLSVVVITSALLFDSACLRWLIELGFVLSLSELFLAAYMKRNQLKPTVLGILPKKSHYILITTGIITIASFVVFLFVPSPTKFILFFAAIISADAGGLFFGKLLGKRHPWFSRKLSPNKTWAGYFGEFVTCWGVCAIVVMVFDIDINLADRWFIGLAPLFAAIGDLCASGAKRQLSIKDSSEFFRNVPIIGKLEWFIKSRDGFLDCFDSIASAFIYYAVISQILA